MAERAIVPTLSPPGDRTSGVLSAPGVCHINSSARGIWGAWSECWTCRRLIYVFFWRDVKVRYQQTILGATWAILQPLLTMLVFTLIFGRIAKVSSEGIPYPVFVYCGLLPWQFFAQGLNRSTASLVEHRYMLTKVYFPRMILPCSAVLAGLPDFAASLLVLLSLMMFYGIMPSGRIVFLVPLLALTAVVSFACGMTLSALNVRYRDVGYALPFFIQLLLFLTPITYPSSLVPQQWRPLFELNPLAYIVEGFRGALAGTAAPSFAHSLESLSVVVILLLVGILCFHHVARTLADVI